MLLRSPPQECAGARFGVGPRLRGLRGAHHRLGRGRRLPVRGRRGRRPGTVGRRAATRRRARENPHRLPVRPRGRLGLRRAHRRGWSEKGSPAHDHRGAQRLGRRAGVRARAHGRARARAAAGPSSRRVRRPRSEPGRGLARRGPERGQRRRLEARPGPGRLQPGRAQPAAVRLGGARGDAGRNTGARTRRRPRTGRRRDPGIARSRRARPSHARVPHRAAGPGGALARHRVAHAFRRRGSRSARGAAQRDRRGHQRPQTREGAARAEGRVPPSRGDARQGGDLGLRRGERPGQMERGGRAHPRPRPGHGRVRPDRPRLLPRRGARHDGPGGDRRHPPREALRSGAAARLRARRPEMGAHDRPARGRGRPCGARAGRLPGHHRAQGRGRHPAPQRGAVPPAHREHPGGLLDDLPRRAGDRAVPEPRLRADLGAELRERRRGRPGDGAREHPRGRPRPDARGLRGPRGGRHVRRGVPHRPPGRRDALDPRPRVSGARCGRAAGAGGRHRRGRDRAPRGRDPAARARGAAPPVTEDGGHRAPGWRRRPRLQQHAERHPGPRQPGPAAHRPARPPGGQPPGDPLRGPTLARPHPAAARVLAAADDRAPRARPERRAPGHREPPAPAHRRGRGPALRGRPRPLAGVDRIPPSSTRPSRTSRSTRATPCRSAGG